MILLFGNDTIVNMDNVSIIEAVGYNDEQVRIEIFTTSVSWSGDSSDALSRSSVVEKNEWFQYLDAIKNNEKVFVFKSAAN